jgi:glycosyltransferase involved in cell wall biosynthesis
MSRSQDPGPMRICLVATFPPSHERINEYGYHLANELQHNPFLSVTVLADKMEPPQPELPEFDVLRCWKPDSLRNVFTILKAIRQCDPDVVWFNVVFSTFGANNPFAAFLGLCVPMLARLMGYSTHVTLHHLIEILDLNQPGIRFPWIYQLGGKIATKVLLRANSVTVLLPDYRKQLVRKYRGQNVHLRAHGILTARPMPPDFSLRGNPHRILAFGKWGTYKKVEILLEAFEEVAKAIPGARLVIAGENHPNAHGYLERLSQRYAHRNDIEFTGYVAEENIAKLFQSASLMVMPYNSAGGPSGVAYQAAQFGVPILCAEIPDFIDMAQQEGFAMQFFRKGDGKSLAQELVRVLQDEERLHAMAEQNFSAALRVTMPNVINTYLRSFGWYTTARALPGSARFGRFVRRSPRAQLGATLARLMRLPGRDDAAVADANAAPSRRPSPQTAAWD